MTFERMTEYESVGGHAHAVPTVDADIAMMRLAAYEDTGLLPDEIVEYLKNAAAEAYGSRMEDLTTARGCRQK